MNILDILEQVERESRIIERLGKFTTRGSAFMVLVGLVQEYLAAKDAKDRMRFQYNISNSDRERIRARLDFAEDKLRTVVTEP